MSLRHAMTILFTKAFVLIRGLHSLAPHCAKNLKHFSITHLFDEGNARAEGNAKAEGTSNASRAEGNAKAEG
jgi:hypothetical protein